MSEPTAPESPPTTLSTDSDPLIPPGTVIQDTPAGVSTGNGKIHQVLASDLAAYMAGSKPTVTARCGFVWAPSIGDDGVTETCRVCTPVYTWAS